MSNTVSFTIEEKESEPSDTGTSDTPNIKPSDKETSDTPNTKPSDKETSDTPNTKPSGTKPSVTPSKKPSVIKKKVTVQKPTGLKLNNIKKRKVKITWKKAKNVSGYEIYRCTKKNGKYKRIITIKKGGTIGCINSKLKTRQRYYYKIRSYKIVGKKKYYSSFTGIKNIKVTK